jgi:hypothetical protein
MAYSFNGQKLEAAAVRILGKKTSAAQQHEAQFVEPDIAAQHF